MKFENFVYSVINAEPGKTISLRSLIEKLSDFSEVKIINAVSKLKSNGIVKENYIPYVGMGEDKLAVTLLSVPY